MAQGWRQVWIDLVDSLRGRPPAAGRTSEAPPVAGREGPRDQATDPPALAGSRQRADGGPAREETAAPVEAGPDDAPRTIGHAAASADPQADPDAAPPVLEHGAAEPSNGSRRFYAAITLIVVLAAGLGLVYYLESGADLFRRQPPAPDVVATFDGGRITLGDVEAHLKLLVPSRLGELKRTPDAMLSIVEDLVADRLVLRWAAARKPELDESFRHTMKHVNERLSIDSFGNQLHEEIVPVAESEIRKYYEAERDRFGGQPLSEVRDRIRRILVAEREPEFVEGYIARLRTNASITRDLELLEVPPPRPEELQSYYSANLDEFALPRRATIDEIEVPLSGTGGKAKQQASDLLLRIRGGTSFREAADLVPDARLSIGRLVAEGTRHPDWDRNVFVLAPGELGSVFQAGDAFYVVRLLELRPAGIQELSEVRSVVTAAVMRQKERDWFDANAEKTLFTLKGKRYTLGQFYKEYLELPPSVRREYAGTEGMKKLTERLIERMLLVSDTYDRLLDVKTKPLADEYRVRLLEQIMEQEEVDDKIEVTEAEVRQFYEENRERLAYPPKARVRYIRIGLGTTRDEERRARERAEEAYDKLAPGLFGTGADFADVAREYSEDPETAANGGELEGWVGESNDVLLELTNHPFHEQILRLQPGKISTPFQLGESLYIVEVLERRESQPLKFEEAKPVIEEALKTRKHRALAADLQAKLLNNANVEMYPQVLDAYRESISQADSEVGR